MKNASTAQKKAGATVPAAASHRRPAGGRALPAVPVLQPLRRAQPVGNAPLVAQRIMQVGDDIYSVGARGGFGIAGIKKLIKDNKKKDTNLRYAWKKDVEEYMYEEDVSPRAFDDVDDLVSELSRSVKRRTASVKNKEQDEQIRALNTGFTPDEQKGASILTYESGKVMGNFVNKVKRRQDYKDTVTRIGTIKPGLRSANSDFTHSDSSFVNMLALSNAEKKRLDYMAPDGVHIDTHGYESKKKREVSPEGLRPFSLSTVKIGPQISSYSKEMKTDGEPDANQLDYLNATEMQRLPALSVQTGMKRKFYEQGDFDKEQAMSNNHSHSSVEFRGAITGSGLTNSQKENLSKQQKKSNYAILKTAFEICPDVTVGESQNGKKVVTPREEMTALKKLIGLIQNTKSNQQEKDQAKAELRKLLFRVLRGATDLMDVDSGDEGNPPSPYNASHYS